MVFKHLKRHGHGHGHGHKRNKHGGRHEKFGGPFKHPGHHMDKEFLKRKHFRGLDCERGCFSESELPDTTTQNVEAGGQDRTIPGKYYRRRHHWRWCYCVKNAPTTTTENVVNGEKGNDSAVAAENVEAGENTAVVPATSTQNVEGQNNTEVCYRKGWHYFGHHGGRRCGFIRSCPRCTQTTDATAENKTNTEVEKDANVWKCYREHYKGKRGHGFGRPCRQCGQDGRTTDNKDTTDDEGGIKHGYIRKHHRGRFEGRKGHKFGFFEDRHHGGKWGHGSHKRHHRGWGRHGCCILMVDAAVNTGDSETEGNAVQEVNIQENSNPAPNMEQDVTQEVSQEQAESGNADQVSEVADNLRKSSLE